MPDSTSLKLAKQVQQIAQEYINIVWLQKYSNCEIEVKESKKSGSTAAVLYKANVSAKLFIKFDMQTIEKELKGYKILKKTGFKNMPSPIVPDGKILLLPHVDNGLRLHDLVVNNRINKARRIYQDFLNEMKKLWLATKSPHTPDKLEYIKRLDERIKKITEGLKINDTMKISINNKEYTSLDDIVEKITSRLNRAKARYSCTAHRDEHPLNVLITSNPEIPWALIDLPNVSQDSDWIYCIAKMLHWWRVYYGIEVLKSRQPKENEFGSINTKDNKINLEFDRKKFIENIPSRCKNFERMTLDFAHDIAKEFKEEKRIWQKRLKIALFVVLFGGIPYHFKTNRFAIPILWATAFDNLERTI